MCGFRLLYRLIGFSGKETTRCCSRNLGGERQRSIPLSSFGPISGLRGHSVQPLLPAAEKEAELQPTWNSLSSEGDKS